jgi:hypothetical protein
MVETVKVPPDPSRMIEGLRDTGYEFPTAIADIIDNSIAAKATLVEVNVSMDYKGNIEVTICDNGCGMDWETLVAGMQYGSPQRPDPSSLGKFGLGMKTASTAFCRVLSVVTRSSGRAPLVKASWDLNHVVQVHDWELLKGTPTSAERELLERVSQGGPGTLVVWQQVDRLLKSYYAPGGTFAQRALEKQIGELKEHLAMVYQRFLDPTDNRAGSIEIRVNAERIAPWDPFCEDLSELVADEEMEVEIDGKGRVPFRVRAFVLPRKEEFVDPERATRARVGNQMQGVYVYREQRLIHGPDWLGMFSKEPHGSLLRVEFSFDHRLDEAFHIDIKKSKILLNEDLYNWLDTTFLPAPRRAADERYRKGQKRQIEDLAKSAHDASNRSILAAEPKLDLPNVSVVDSRKGDVLVENKQGQVHMKLDVTGALRPGEVFVQPVDGLPEGILWRPAIIGTHRGVQINTAQPYYHKVYVPNLRYGVTVQGIDSLLWALGMAELSTVNEATKRHFAEMRYEVSKLLRELVEALPEPNLEAPAEQEAAGESK